MNNDQADAEFGTLSLIDDASSPDGQSEKRLMKNWLGPKRLPG